MAEGTLSPLNYRLPAFQAFCVAVLKGLRGGCLVEGPCHRENARISVWSWPGRAAQAGLFPFLLRGLNV